ncbi:hypothetical protein LOK49_LG02G03318 [Camellia lanceoleosa]|uniref:Uncharacterized protein n=1 Tax=Camellia lanceoleosa TaxID=1840588 RepID=A0ACC0IJE5_9ERIC|nr:hypothetical protein LOK49_LG02G03318 [Camellia lanceoleosa]
MPSSRVWFNPYSKPTAAAIPTGRASDHSNIPSAKPEQCHTSSSLLLQSMILIIAECSSSQQSGLNMKQALQQAHYSSHSNWRGLRPCQLQQPQSENHGQCHHSPSPHSSSHNSALSIILQPPY